MTLSHTATAADWRRLAQKRLPRFYFDYIDGAAGEEQTLAANIQAFADVRLRQRVLVNVEGTSTQATLLGEDCALPLALAPVGLAGMAAPRGEVQAARAAKAAGVPFTLSTVGICPMSEVAAATQAPFWFQLYMLRDRGAVSDILQQAWDSGCRTLVFTVDLPVTGLRWRDVRHGMADSGGRAALIKALHVLSRPGWLRRVAVGGKPLTFGNLQTQVPGARDLNAFRAWVDAQFDPSVTWHDIAWLRAQWKGRLVLKGILTVQDAQAAIDAGANALVVSNHGGRQLDSAPATVSVLPAIAQAVGNRTEVLVDGGIRSGVDIFKALALGAHGVLAGRPWVWALAAEGEAGVQRLLRHWQRELQTTMMLCGVTRVADIRTEHLQSDLPTQNLR